MPNTVEIAIIVAILFGALLAFVSQRFRLELVAMGVLVVLVLTRLLSVPEALSGFSSPAVITVGGVLVISRGLVQSGVAGIIGRAILRVAGRDRPRILALVMATAGLLSAFMNDVGATAVLLPTVIDIGRRTKISPSKLLIPLSFATLLGGSTTLIGTPPNILVSDYLVARGLEPFSFFDFTPVGVAAAVAGIVFMVFLGRRLLPTRVSAGGCQGSLEASLAQPEAYHLEKRLFRLQIPQGSILDGKTIGQTRFRQSFGVSILGILHRHKRKLAPGNSDLLHSEDVLLVKGTPQEVARLEDNLNVRPQAPSKVELDDLESGDVAVIEAVLGPHSHLVGRTLREMRLREEYSLNALAIWRRGRAIRVGVADEPLEFGDALLMQGSPSDLQRLQTSGHFLVVDAQHSAKVHPEKAPCAVVALATTVTLAVLGVVPMSIAAMIGAGLMIFTGCLTVEEAYGSIDWPVIFLIAGMIPAGIALEKSGAAQVLAQQIISITHSETTGTLFGVLALLLLFSQIMPNRATAVLMAPVAVSAAQSVGADPRTFLLGVGVAASMAFATPIGHPANVLVMAPGGYRFADYIKVGLPLSLVTLLAIGTVLCLACG